MPLAYTYERGQRFEGSRLTFLHEVPKLSNNRRAKFLCDCGNETETTISSVATGRSKSCGCYARDMASEANTVHTHLRDGQPEYHFPGTRLVFIGEAPVNEHMQRCIKVRCGCSNELILPLYYIMTGNTKSCGCYRQENTANMFTKHGLRSSEVPENHYLYDLWYHMNERVNTHEAYIRKGIGIASLWTGLNGVDFFIDYILITLGHRPTPEHSLDRIDNNGDYTAGNLRWATSSEQMRNTEKTIYLKLGNVIKPLPEWAESSNLSYGALKHRHIAGWSDEDVLTKPPGYRPPYKTKELAVKENLEILNESLEWAGIT